MKDVKYKKWKNPYLKRFDEAPLTIVKDLNKALNVKLIQWTEITGALREFVECGPLSSAPNFKGAGSSLEELINSNALWQGLETIHFTFKVTGCSRMLTHQLVRHRIGITFSQQCSDSVDWRHQNIVLPRTVSEEIIPTLLFLKEQYAEMLDKKMTTCQEARYILPQCIETFIYIHVSLATLIPMIKKRACTMSQPWETYLWAIRTKRALLSIFPEFAKIFESDCLKKRCFYHASKNHPASAYLYQPDVEHNCGSFTWNPDSYIYPDTHLKMNKKGTKHITQYYVGKKKVSNEHYTILAKEYGIWES